MSAGGGLGPAVVAVPFPQRQKQPQPAAISASPGLCSAVRVMEGSAAFLPGLEGSTAKTWLPVCLVLVLGALTASQLECWKPGMRIR